MQIPRKYDFGRACAGDHIYHTPWLRNVDSMSCSQESFLKIFGRGKKSRVKLKQAERGGAERSGRDVQREVVSNWVV